MAKLSILLALGLILLLGQHVHCHGSESTHESAHESVDESTHESSEAQEEGPYRTGLLIPDDQYLDVKPSIILAGYSFSDLVGKTGEEARDAILAEYPTFDVNIVEENSPITMDWNRVYVFVDAEGKVVRPPVIE